MRIIILGVGAVGGTIGGLLALAGEEVLGIARGAQLAALRARGLLLRQPGQARTVRFDLAEAPAGVAFRPDDAILLCTKTSQTEAALEDLRAAGVTDQPVFCTQNGVENERLAARRFPNVHGITVLLPALYTTPGEVAAFGDPRPGVLDVGRFPSGHDGADTALVAALERAGFAAYVQDDVMARKHSKLLMNLGNIVQAAHGKGAANDPITTALRAEARSVLAAAGIAIEDVGEADPRREMIRFGEIAGVPYLGGSTTQSLERGTGSLETDYLNGEIALLGRLHGVPAPLNAWYTRLAARMARDRLPPFSIPRDEALALLT